MMYNNTSQQLNQGYQFGAPQFGVGAPSPQVPQQGRGKQIMFWITTVLFSLCTLFQFVVFCAYASQKGGVDSDWGRFLTGQAWAVNDSADYTWTGKGGRQLHDGYKKWQCFWVGLRCVLTGFLTLASFFAARTESFSVVQDSNGKKPGAFWIPSLVIGGFIVGIGGYLLPYLMWELAEPFVKEGNQNSIRVGVMAPLFISAVSCLVAASVGIAAWLETKKAQRAAACSFESAPLLAGPIFVQQAPMYGVIPQQSGPNYV